MSGSTNQSQLMLNIQNYEDLKAACTKQQLPVPTQNDLQTYASLCLIKTEPSISYEVTCRFVDDEEMLHYNSTHRDKNTLTNVLSFPGSTPFDSSEPYLGDIAINLNITYNEAIELNIPFIEHLIHLFVHSMLHLQGYDHHNKQDTIIMQKHEVDILQKINIDNPYSS